MTRIDPRLMRRFKLRGDPGAAVKLRYGLWKRSWHSTGSTLPAEDELWLRVVERESGAVGRLCPRGERYWWAKEVAREALARRVLVAKIPWTVPLMHVGPGIVHAEPPPVIERPTLSLGAAAECALMACEVVVRTRALRCNGDGDCVYFGPRNLRVIEADGRWRIAWLVPGIAELAVLDRLAARAKQQGKDHSAADTTPAGEVRDLFFSLLPAAARGARPELRALAARHGDGRDDVVSLAASFLALLDTPGEWTDRVAELAAIAGGPPAEQDWDFIPPRAGGHRQEAELEVEATNRSPLSPGRDGPLSSVQQALTLALARPMTLAPTRATALRRALLRCLSVQFLMRLTIDADLPLPFLHILQHTNIRGPQWLLARTP
jgi:hypothetical protein